MDAAVFKFHDQEQAGAGASAGATFAGDHRVPELEGLEGAAVLDEGRDTESGAVEARVVERQAPVLGEPVTDIDDECHVRKLAMGNGWVGLRSERMRRGRPGSRRMPRGVDHASSRDEMMRMSGPVVEFPPAPKGGRAPTTSLPALPRRVLHLPLL